MDVRVFLGKEPQSPMSPSGIFRHDGDTAVVAKDSTVVDSTVVGLVAKDPTVVDPAAVKLAVKPVPACDCPNPQFITKHKLN